MLLSCDAPSQETTLHSQANVVIVPALVKSAKGEIVYGLEAKDFIVQDDGVEQTVHLDEAAEGSHVSIVVAIQRGRRANYEFPRIRGLSSMLDPLIEQAMARVAIVEFDSQVQLVQDFTGNSERIAETLKELEPGDGGATIVDAISEEPVAFEALLRWHHPTRGVLPPLETVALAEDAGLMGRIGDWVIRTACAEAAAWPDHLRIAVNLSPAQLADPALPAIVTGALAATALDPERLELELGESLFTDDGKAAERLAALRGLGICVHRRSNQLHCDKHGARRLRLPFRR